MSIVSSALGSWGRTRKTIALLVLIIALGSFLRIYGLGAESIWLDEAHSVRVSSENLASVVRATTGHHLPLYFVILHFWMSLLGTSEVAVRSLSAILGIISIPLIYYVGSQFFNKRVGLIGSFLSAISLYHILYSQEARPYALLLLLSLLSFLLFVQILKQDKKWFYLFYFLTNILLIYTHVFALFTIAAQMLFLFLFWTKYKPQRFKLLSVQMATVLAILPVVSHVFGVATAMVEQGFWIREPSLMSLYGTLGTFAGGKHLAILIFLCLALIAPLSIRRIEGKLTLTRPLESLKGISWGIRLEALREILLLVIWLFLPLVLAFIISKVITPIYVHRYLIGASPALYLLVAKGLSNLKVRSIIYPVILLIVLLALPNLANYHTEYGKSQWRDVAQHVELNAQENDVLVFCANFAQSPFDYYYKGNLDEFGISNTVEDTEEIAAFVNEATSGKQRLWLILGHSGSNPPIETYLRDRYPEDALVMERNFVKVEVFLFDLKEESTNQ